MLGLFRTYLELLICRLFFHLSGSCAVSASHLTEERLWHEHLPHVGSLVFAEIETLLDRFQLFQRAYGTILEHIIQDKILLYLVEPELAHGDFSVEFSLEIEICLKSP